MEGTAIQKYVKMSPRKLRLIADMVRKVAPHEAVAVLPLVNKRASDPVRKTVRAAIANAVQKGANPEELKFKEIQISQGPKLKRFRAVSRGRAHGYVKKMSHIKVVVEQKTEKKEKNG